MPIEKVRPGMEVFSLGPDYRLYRVPVLEVLESGVREVVRLRTRSGRTLVLTPDHPLLTPEGWKPLATCPWVRPSLYLPNFLWPDISPHPKNGLPSWPCC